MLNHLCSIYQLIVKEGKKTMKNQETLINLLDTLNDATRRIKWAVEDIRSQIIDLEASTEHISEKVAEESIIKLKANERRIVEILSLGNFESVPALVGITKASYESVKSGLYRIGRVYEVEKQSIKAVGYRKVYRVKTGADGQPVKKSA